MNMPYRTGATGQNRNRRSAGLRRPRGKVIGGSSSINGMIYVRGHAGDYAHWEESGAAGWGYADVLPYFRRMETSHGGEAPWRGTGGPLHVTRGRATTRFTTHRRGRAAGYAATPTITAIAEGFGPADMTVWKGRRWSAANAYLRPAIRRGGQAVTGALVDRFCSTAGVQPACGIFAAASRMRFRRMPRSSLPQVPSIHPRFSSGPGSARRRC